MKTLTSIALAALTLPAGLLEGKSTVMKSEFGKMPDGTVVWVYALKNSKGMEAKITTYGAAVVSLMVPDKNGKRGDVVLGCSDLDSFRRQAAFLGAIVGRYGNRIAKAQFKLDGHEYKLPNNDHGNTLHGGPQGFDKKVWDVRRAEPNLLELHYLSKDGEEGFPGDLNATVTYTVTENNELRIDYAATTDKPTVVNLTNHAYFNLAGQGNGDILGQKMMINADHFLPVNPTLIPTGELRPVAGTPFDFRKPGPIGSRINASDEQIKIGGGYDHCWVLNKKGGELSLAARAMDPASGRVMEVLTTEPGIQFYTGNFLDGSITGKDGKVYKKRYAFCLETQHYPDSPNQPKFPTTTLNPGGKYTTTTIYKFSHE